MIAVISKKNIIKCYGRQPFNKAAKGKDNSLYCDVLDVICDYITEKLGEEIIEENAYFDVKGDQIVATYQLVR